MEILSVKDLVKIYLQGNDRVVALDHCSFKVEKGEFIAVVGASGSGKSTLLHICGGLDTPTAGSVFLEGKDIIKFNKNDLAIYRNQKIGFIFQQYNLLPTLTAKENIILPSLINQNGYDKEYFNDLVKTLDISNRLSHLPSELSGGQQQRVAVARALINKPSLIFADEPTGNLDKKTANELLELLISSMKKYKQTIMFITHDSSIAAHADRIFKIDAGVVSE